MNGTLFIWIVFLVLLMQPVISRRLLAFARHKVIADIESARGSRVILLVHRTETISLLGLPIYRYIDVDDAEQVLRAIRETDPDKPIDLVLHTPGGLALAALQIARALRAWPGKVTVFVPHYAMSGGTLIALAADRIVMADHAVLGPVDPQIGGYPAASILSVVARKSIDEVEDETLIFADIAHKAVNELRLGISELLGDRYEPERAGALAKALTEGLWTHDQAIGVPEAKGMGFEVDTDMPAAVLDLMKLYQRPALGARTVEYIKKRS